MQVMQVRMQVFSISFVLLSPHWFYGEKVTLLSQPILWTNAIFNMKSPCSYASLVNVFSMGCTQKASKELCFQPATGYFSFKFMYGYGCAAEMRVRAAYCVVCYFSLYSCVFVFLSLIDFYISDLNIWLSKSFNMYWNPLKQTKSNIRFLLSFLSELEGPEGYEAWGTNTLFTHTILTHSLTHSASVH